MHGFVKPECVCWNIIRGFRITRFLFKIVVVSCLGWLVDPRSSMAQLPPKIPTMTQNCNSFLRQKMPPTMENFIPANTNPTANLTPPCQPPRQQPSWVDDLLEFSSAPHGAHRRSASDSITFLETSRTTFLEECGRNLTTGTAATNGCERLDDAQLMSMFNDDLTGSLPSNPSTPSDQNSNNDEKPKVSDHPTPPPPKNEPGEVDSSCEPEPPGQTAPSSNTNNDHVTDPKRVKRILANRQSAQRSRVRKLQYISELERSVTTLQIEVSALSPRVALLDHQRLILNVDNSALKQRIAALAQDKIFTDAHQEALKKEIERLRQIYHPQRLEKKGNPATNNVHSANPPSGAVVEQEQEQEHLLS